MRACSSFTKKIMILFMAVSVLMLTSCKTGKITEDKVKDIDYTVVTDADIPDTLRNAIEEKKEESFKLSYSDGEALYIAVGYGRQQSGGYSITVDDLYLTSNNIVFATTLNGPGKEASGTDTPSYPYLIVKTEYMDCEIVYE